MGLALECLDYTIAVSDLCPNHSGLRLHARTDSADRGTAPDLSHAGGVNRQRMPVMINPCLRSTGQSSKGLPPGIVPDTTSRQDLESLQTNVSCLHLNFERSKY